MSAFDTLCRGKKGWFVFNCCSSSWSVLFWSHICYDYTRPTLLIWPFSSDMALYYTVTITALLFLPFLSLLLMWDQSVFVHAVWQLSAMFTTPEGEASLSQSRWGGLVHPLSPSLPLPTIKHFGCFRAGKQQQAYRVARSFCICWDIHNICIVWDSWYLLTMH